MATSTPHLQLHKPDPPENVNVEQDLNANSDKIDAFASRVDFGWIFIDGKYGSNQETGNFVIDLTAGGKYPANSFGVVKIFLRGQLNDEGWFGFRVNDDNAAGLHRNAFEAKRIQDNVIQSNGTNNLTVWRVAYWSTAFNNIAEATIHMPTIDSNPSFQSEGYRAAGGETSRWRSEGHGDLAFNRNPTSLTVMQSTAGASVQNMRWAAMGLMFP
jgi:hypothetical protein